MIAIIDSGSTKSDWIVMDEKGEEVLRTKTIGFNPYFINSEEIEKEVKKNNELMQLADKINSIYFYGAGCSSENLCTIVKKAFDSVFSNSQNNIEHDMKAAAYAAYKGKPAIVCILGTGSNSCYFDGETIYEETPSLAFILGDEGSGNHLGRELLRSYFTKKLPNDISNKFKEKYNLSVEEMNKNVYQNQFANAYLASFSKFVAEHKEEPAIQKIIYNCLRDFLFFQVMPYPQIKNAEINFIGSVSYYYEDILRSVASEFNLKVGHIIQNPIDNLVEYHKIYILPKK